jgi:hypothetical protein
VLIDDLDRGVDQTKDALVSQQSRLKRLLKQSRDNWKFFCVIGAHATRPPPAIRPPPALRPSARPVLAARVSARTPTLHVAPRIAVLVVIVLGVILYLIFTQGN